MIAIIACSTTFCKTWRNFEIYREIETFRIALCLYTEFMRACRTAHNTRVA